MLNVWLTAGMYENQWKGINAQIFLHVDWLYWRHAVFQTVSVAISVLTLTFISVDRWYAICFPLKFKSTTGRAKTAIIIIWLLALAVGEHAHKTNGRIENRVFFYRGTEHYKSERPGWSLWSRTFYGSQSRDKNKLPVFIECRCHSWSIYEVLSQSRDKQKLLTGFSWFMSSSKSKLGEI